MEQAEARPRDPGDPGDRWFWACAALALALHAWLLVQRPGLWGGADLFLHLRLIELFATEPALRSVYPPVYHALGALLAPAVGLAAYTKLFAFAAAVVYIAGFRSFQRAAALPAASAALAALWPYAFSLSWCIPKVEAAGFGIAFFAMGRLIRRRYVGAALALAATFWVHTLAALFLGFAGGVWAIVARDRRALVALAAGSLGFAPLFAAHLAAGCSPDGALMLSQNLRPTASWSSAEVADVIAPLASPPMLALALLGARPLWARDRALAILCAALAVLYLNELWLAPFPTRTALDLLRGLSMLGVPVAVAGGLAIAGRPRAAPWLLGVCALWSVGSVFLVVPRSCYTREIGVDELRGLEVARCRIFWRGPAIRRDPHLGPPRGAGGEAPLTAPRDPGPR